MPGKHQPLAQHNSNAAVCVGDPRTTSFAWMGPADIAQLPMESARCFEILTTHCQQGKLRGWRMWEQPPAYSGPRRWAKGPPFTCLESQIGPPRWGCKKQFKRSRWPRAAVLSASTPFFLNVMSRLLNLDHREMIYQLEVNLDILDNTFHYHVNLEQFRYF